jgi:suppressor of ftsI
MHSIRPIAVIVLASLCSFVITETPAQLLPNPPELRAKDHALSLTLHAAITSDGRDSFYFYGRPNAPTLRLSPGDQLKITYINDLPAKLQEPCLIPPCMDMTNLHFHGLTVSPDALQDDVLTMMAMPGQSLHYAVRVPKDHAPGLYWYHTHPHGESYQQALDGMSGALVIEGIESYYPALAGLPEQILIVRGRSTVRDPQAADLMKRVEVSSVVCGGEAEAPEEVFTVNGSLRPQIEIAPGERQFWRVVNASADRYLDLQLEGQMIGDTRWMSGVVASDGHSIHGDDLKHVLMPPAGRLEAIVN